MPRAGQPQPSHSVVAVAYDGLCTFEFGVATELFGLARPELDVDWYEFAVIAAEDRPIQTLGGLTMSAPFDLGAIAAADTIVLPGWRDPTEPPPPDLLDALRAAHNTGARIMSICSGVFVLAATGLLDDKAATTHWRYTELLRAAHPAIDVRPDVLYIDNGQLLTSAGSAAGIDLGLHMIRRDHGPAIANAVARRLVLPAHRDGGQAQFIASAVSPNESSSLAPTLDWALEQLHEPLTVADLAQHAGVSPRTFARRFDESVGETPLQWLTVHRVRRAQELLETTDLTVDVIAQRSGLGSAANLRRRFARHAQTTPSRYRAAFQRGGRGTRTGVLST